MNSRLTVLLSALLLGCGGQLAKNGLPTCGQGGVQCPASPKTASKAVYHCAIDLGPNVIYGGVHESDLTVCLPSNLNSAVANASELAAINGMSMADYDKAIFDYGEGEVLNHTVALMAFDGNGSKCGDLGAALQRTTTACIEILPAVDGTFCDVAANLATVSCCPQGACPPNNSCKNVVTSSGINPNGCPCNFLPSDPLECNIQTGTVVYPTPGDDPPGITSGIIEHVLSQDSSIAVDSSSSSIKTHVHIVDSFNVGHDDTETSTLNGIANVYGAPNQDGTASVLFDMYLQASDTKLHFTGVDVVLTVDVPATHITINGGTGGTHIALDSSGNGIIPKGALNVVLEAIVDGQKVIVPQSNDDALAINVDFKNKSVLIPTFTLTPFGNVDVTVMIAGTITNQPPIVDAGNPQTVECTSSSGATATLHGGVKDPDNNILAAPWVLQGAPITSGQIPLTGTVVFRGFDAPTATIPVSFVPPSLTTGLTLVAQDGALQTALSQTTVTVVDTIPPQLTLDSILLVGTGPQDGVV